MTAITDTRKRSRDEENSDFMPISKRINNLSITSQQMMESAPLHQVQPSNNSVYQHINNNNCPTNYTMAINHDEIQSNYVGAITMHNSPNEMQYQQHQQHPIHHHQHGQSIDPSNNNQMVFSSALNNNNNSNLAATATNGVQAHHQIQKHQQLQVDSLQSNNEMSLERYSPELTADENPFYYSKNKLLYDLHIERERRNHNHP